MRFTKFAKNSITHDFDKIQETYFNFHSKPICNIKNFIFNLNTYSTVQEEILVESEGCVLTQEDSVHDIDDIVLNMETNKVEISENGEDYGKQYCKAIEFTPEKTGYVRITLNGVTAEIRWEYNPEERTFILYDFDNRELEVSISYFGVKEKPIKMYWAEEQITEEEEEEALRTEEALKKVTDFQMKGGDYEEYDTALKVLAENKQQTTEEIENVFNQLLSCMVKNHSH